MTLEKLEKIAQKYKVKVNLETLGVIIKGLKQRKLKYGKEYCPCQVIRNNDTICPCKEFRETKNCHCNLFITY